MKFTVAEWLEFTEPFEGHTDWFYLDVRGLVTIGYGNLVDPFTDAQGIDYTRAGGAPATLSEVQSAWLLVKNLKGKLRAGVLWEKCGGGVFEGMTTIRATEASLQRLVANRLLSFWSILNRRLSGLPEAPRAAQMGLMSMAWALGPGFPAMWPRFSSAWNARNWNAASRECQISTVGNPGLAPRNNANVCLFLDAAREQAAIAATEGEDEKEDT